MNQALTLFILGLILLICYLVVKFMRNKKRFFVCEICKSKYYAYDEPFLDEYVGRCTGPSKFRVGSVCGGLLIEKINHN